MKGIKNENDGKKSLHGIRRNGKTPLAMLLLQIFVSVVYLSVHTVTVLRRLDAKTSQ